MPVIPKRKEFDLALQDAAATVFIVVGDPAADAQLKRVYEYADGYASGHQVAYLADALGYFSDDERKGWSLKKNGWTVLVGKPPKHSPLSGLCAELFLPNGQLDTLAVIDIFAAGDEVV